MKKYKESNLTLITILLVLFGIEKLSCFSKISLFINILIFLLGITLIIINIISIKSVKNEDAKR